MPEAAAAYPGWKRAEGEIVRVFVKADGATWTQRITDAAAMPWFVEHVERWMEREEFFPVETPDA